MSGRLFVQRGRWRQAPHYLVVRCAGGWAGDAGRQAFAVTVELAHEAQIQLYERLRQRLRLRA